jgi:uncharacterized protein
LSQEPGIDFITMVHALARPQAFPFKQANKDEITTVQTHASAVLLTPSLVYKLKKPQNFGFFDYSTPQQRHHFCCQEVILNRRLAPDVYLGVAPVLMDQQGRFRFAETQPVEAVPAPGTQIGPETVVDFAVVMRRLADTDMLKHLVQSDNVNPTLLAAIARFVAHFHTTTYTDEHIASFGDMNVVGGNWEENFEQMHPYIGRTLDASTYEQISSYIHNFMRQRASFFTSRVREQRIRDCHGDLRLDHIYVLNHQEHTQAPRIAILDCIEFNDRFRYGDVAGEIAFLIMELDGISRNDLSRNFLDAYIEATGDTALREILPFYLSYRACVRGKVSSFQIDEPEVPATQRQLMRDSATELFAQAAYYAHGPVQPVVMLIGGLMGTGKSTLAARLHHELGWTLLSSDVTRKRLAQRLPAQPLEHAFGQGLYTAEWNERTYAALREEMSGALTGGRSVLLDASFIRRTDRQAIEREALAHGAQVFFIECASPPELTLQRLAQRWRQRTGAGEQKLAASQASDGRPDLYARQRARWESFDAHEEAGVQHVLLSTTYEIARQVEQILDLLDLPRLACPLT